MGEKKRKRSGGQIRWSGYRGLGGGGAGHRTPSRVTIRPSHRKEGTLGSPGGALLEGEVEEERATTGVRTYVPVPRTPPPPVEKKKKNGKQECNGKKARGGLGVGPRLGEGREELRGGGVRV